ncbi:MAG: DUF4328 domain-containing protein [Verrucomicrobiota bacterium]
MNWYWAIDGEQRGPVSAESLAGLRRSGEIGDETLVWKAGTADWVPFGESELGVASEGVVSRPESDEANPYAPPLANATPTPGMAGRATLSEYRSPKALSRITTVFMVLLVLLFVALTILTVEYPHLFADDAVIGEDETAIAMAFGLVGIGILGVYLMCVIFWCVWTNRCAKNVRALGANPRLLEYTPGWAVGWYFIPIAFWWKPFQAHREIWRATESPESPGTGEVPGAVGVWWFFWVVANLVGNVSNRTTDPDVLIPMTIVDLVLTTAAAVYAVIVCRRLTALQDEKAREAAGAEW